MIELVGVKNASGPDKRLIQYRADGMPPMCLYRLFVPRGFRWNVYTPKPGDGMAGDADGIISLPTLTIIPPGGHVRIHSPDLDSPIEYTGSWERIVAGIIFNSKFDYEALEDTEWICLSGVNPAIPGYTLNHILMEEGESYTATENDVLLVCMKGKNFSKAWIATPGSVLKASSKMLIGIVRKDDV